MNASDLLLDYLIAEGVEYVFGVPGSACQPLFGSFMKRRGVITPILTKHEEGGAFMADGYARMRRGLGVCLSTAGPGATNLLTGVATAYTDGVPLLVLTGQVPTMTFGKGAIQEASPEGTNSVAMFNPVTKYSSMIFDSNKAGEMIRRAIRTALSGRWGPVHLSLPSNIMLQEVRERVVPSNRFRVPAEYFDRERVKAACKVLVNHGKAAFLAGTGTSFAGANERLMTLAEWLNIPVATTPKAKGCFPENHELSLGILGVAGNPRADKYLLESDPLDTLITVGCGLTEMSTHCWDPRLQPRKNFIQIDIDPEAIGKNYQVDIGLVGDARVILEEIYWQMKRELKNTTLPASRSLPCLQQICASTSRFIDQEKMFSEAMPLKPQRAIAEAREALDDDAVVFVDCGEHFLFALHYYTANKPRTFCGTIGFGAMGYGVCAPIGAKLAAPERTVVSITGDGCFQMNGMEIATAVNYNIPVVWIVFNNGLIGLVHRGFNSFYNDSIATTFKRVDFVKVAEGLGATGFKVEKPGELTATLRQAVKLQKPCVLDVYIDPEESAPMGSRIRALKRMMLKQKELVRV